MEKLQLPEEQDKTLSKFDRLNSNTNTNVQFNNSIEFESKNNLKDETVPSTPANNAFYPSNQLTKKSSPAKGLKLPMALSQSIEVNTATKSCFIESR